MDKVDLRRDIASYAAPRGRFEVVTVPAQQYLMIDGHGDPNTASAYREALETLYATVRAEVAAKGKAPALDLLRRAELDEGLVVQTLHIGPYDDEGPVLARMHHEFIPQQGLTMSGRHHEIYLGDPRRTAPERLRTILRQPVRAG